MRMKKTIFKFRGAFAELAQSGFPLSQRIARVSEDLRLIIPIPYLEVLNAAHLETQRLGCALAGRSI